MAVVNVTSGLCDYFVIRSALLSVGDKMSENEKQWLVGVTDWQWLNSQSSLLLTGLTKDPTSDQSR